MHAEYAVFGLGNPGERYRATRHNLGFRVADALVGGRRGRWAQGARGAIAPMDVAGRAVLVVKPRTYMNLSGDAVAAVVEGEGLPVERCLVVCDDIALPLGRVRLRRAGSDGGHNGLKSIIERLGTEAFPRLRLGVGPVPERVDPAEFVLAEFDPSEVPALDAMLETAAACVEAWVVEGVERAMSRFNAPREDAAEAEGD